MNKKFNNEQKPDSPGWFSNLRITKGLVGFIIALLVIALLIAGLRSFWYFEVIENDEIGVPSKRGRSLP